MDEILYSQLTILSGISVYVMYDSWMYTVFSIWLQCIT